MLILDGKIVTWGKNPQILEGQAIYVHGNRIEEMGPQFEMLERYPREERMYANGQYIMPGNICAHTHFYGAFSRGMAIPGAPAEDFPQILEKLWWPLDRSLLEQDVRYSTLVCLVDAIRHGTTTLIDHHASPECISGSLDVIADAVEQSGLRASLCYEVTDRNGQEGALQGIRENTRFLDRVARERPANGRLAAMFGFHAGLTVSDATLAASRAAVGEDVGFHIHVAEHSVDEYDSLAKSGMRVVDRLQKFGILGPKTIVVHAVHVDAREIAILAETDTWVSHQPRSNMNNAVGLPAVEDMLRSGVRVCLGNDGFSNAMWEEWKALYLAHKLYHRDPRRMNGSIVAQMAISNNAELAASQFGSARLGEITPGALADLIFVDYQPFTELTAGNLPWHMLFGFHESMITTTIVDGQVLMANREIKTLDAAKIAADARQYSAAVWQRYQEQF